MILVLRRTTAALIDALAIFALLLPLFGLTATVMWLFGYAERYTAYEVTLGFAFCFALLGSHSIGWLPTLGKRVSGIHLVSCRDGYKPSRFALLLRLIVFFAAPSAFLFGSTISTRIAELTDSNARSLLFSVSVFATYFATFLIPALILATLGSEGLHDRLTGIRVESHTTNSAPAVPTRVMGGG